MSPCCLSAAIVASWRPAEATSSRKSRMEIHKTKRWNKVNNLFKAISSTGTVKLFFFFPLAVIIHPVQTGQEHILFPCAILKEEMGDKLCGFRSVQKNVAGANVRLRQPESL